MPMGMFGTPDPNLDGRYETWLDCLWTIEMPVNRAINLTFNSFDVEDSYACSYDYVQVTEHTTPHHTPGHTLCQFLLFSVLLEFYQVF